MNEKHAAEMALEKILDYKNHSNLFLKKGFLSYPEFQQYVKDIASEYFVSAEIATIK